MAESLGNPEKAALIALLLTDGEISTPELKQRHGLVLTKETREKLNKAGLIDSRTKKTPHRHRITQNGRDRCAEALAFGTRPTRPTALLATGWELLASVVDYLGWHDARLADVVLESRIRAAYDKLADRQGEFTRLVGLRAELDGFGRDDVDRVLLAMSRTGLVHLASDSNRKAHTDEDREAAIQIGTEPKHLVAIESA
jgi:hypothetical protein